MRKILPLSLTIGDKYSPAMTITDQAEADDYFEACVEHCLRHMEREGRPMDREEAERIERCNLGYFAGYYDSETRERVERLFRCVHPVFGAIAAGSPTAEQAMAKGMAMIKGGE